MAEYLVKRVADTTVLHGDDAAWAAVPELRVDRFHARSTDHRPDTRVRAVHDGEALLLRFQVHDKYVLSTFTEPNSAVCRDACVEFFVRPRPGRGYFNFEINCCGVLHLGYHEKPLTSGPSGPTGVFVTPELAATVRIVASLAGPITEQIEGPLDWQVDLYVPVAVFEAYVGPLQPLSGSEWTANFYKCASDCSHPHWASWSPIKEKLTFHDPDTFGRLRLG